jgi:phosphoribosylaminoimidazole (AIR) synthetase
MLRLAAKRGMVTPEIKNTVGASLLAMVVNDNACLLAKRSVLDFIASRLAPTIEQHQA